METRSKAKFDGPASCCKARERTKATSHVSFHDLRLAVPRALTRSKRSVSSETLKFATSVFLPQLQRLQWDRQCGWARFASQSGQVQFVTYLEEDLFRCTRTFPSSGTSSGILHALDCGCGRAFHRRVRPQHCCGFRRVFVLDHQLGLHERHRELRAQFRRQSRRRAQPHWRSLRRRSDVPNTVTITDGTANFSATGQALFRRHTWPFRAPSLIPMTSEKADVAAAVYQGSGTATAARLRARVGFLP